MGFGKPIFALNCASFDYREIWMYALGSAAPYGALMLSLALLPQVSPKLWHRFEKVVLAIIAVAAAIAIGYTEPNTYARTFGEMMITEYLPFMAIVFALYTVSGGIYLELNVTGNLKNNILILLTGALLSNFIGTTGASMLLIRPFLRLNRDKPHKTHLGIFFVILVANIGGCLSPLGDPPLFLGYLKGVDFFWITKRAFAPCCLTMVFCLGVFAIVDRFKNGATFKRIAQPSIAIDGWLNVGLILLLVGLTVLAPLLEKKDLFSLGGVTVSNRQLIRDLGYVLIGLLSFAATPKRIHRLQSFDFAPVGEVARVFFVIFLTLIPVAAMLAEGVAGPFGKLFEFAHPSGVANPTRYFWITGALSAFLDNAPTYLLFFKMAGNGAEELTRNPPLLLAISLGSVFMGALTYIGNAPNMLARDVARQSGFPMPGFLSYIGWSLLILLPVFSLISLALPHF